MLDLKGAGSRRTLSGSRDAAVELWGRNQLPRMGLHGSFAEPVLSVSEVLRMTPQGFGSAARDPLPMTTNFSDATLGAVTHPIYNLRSAICPASIAS